MVRLVQMLIIAFHGGRGFSFFAVLLVILEAKNLISFGVGHQFFGRHKDPIAAAIQPLLLTLCQGAGWRHVLFRHILRGLIEVKRMDCTGQDIIQVPRRQQGFG